MQAFKGNKTVYEWDFEELDENGDIIDHDYSETLKGRALPVNCRVCLVRSVGNAFDGVTERDWAYVKDGKLPEFFEYDGHKVPKKYRAELARWLAAD